eukprot:GHVQ01038259.1.p1 GENE.GHVQ01038259.1~~GHVQ01038259.1.p1  ORF type:complete len:358 (+),score=55.15 GHVQ01038259.1:256-1329(+)
MSRIRVHVLGGPEVLKVETEIGGEAQLSTMPNTFLVQIKHAGVNNMDTYIREGKHGRLPLLPYTPGTDFSGVIAAISDTFREGYDQKFKVGSRVFGCLCPGDSRYLETCRKTDLYSNRDFLDHHGTYANLCYVNPDVDIIDVLPENKDFETGAAATSVYLTAYRALFTAGKCRPRETVLVHGGGGGVGSAVIEMTKSIGVRCIATAGSASGLQVCREAGASHVLNHSKEGYIEELLDLTQGDGVNMVVETSADKHLGIDLQILKRGGRVVVVNSRGNVQISPTEIMSKESTVTGVSLFNATRDELLEAQAYVTAALRSGAFSPIIQTFTLAEAANAHREFMLNSAGRIVLQVSDRIN